MKRIFLLSTGFTTAAASKYNSKRQKANNNPAEAMHTFTKPIRTCKSAFAQTHDVRNPCFKKIQFPPTEEEQHKQATTTIESRGCRLLLFFSCKLPRSSPSLD